MTRVGATGHQELPQDAHAYLVEEVRNVLAACGLPLHAITSLAAGADQLIAREALRDGAHLHVVVPASGYEATFSPPDLQVYEYLLAQADEVTTLDFAHPNEQAYWAAGKVVVEQCEVLIAIWDGQPARGLGGTGDVVRYANDLGRDVRVIWPSSVVRE